MTNLFRFKVTAKCEDSYLVIHDNICPEEQLDEVFTHIVVAYVMSYVTDKNLEHCASNKEFFENNPDTFLIFTYGNPDWTGYIHVWDKNTFEEKIDALYLSTIEEEEKHLQNLRKQLSSQRSDINAIYGKVQYDLIQKKENEDEYGITYEQWDAMKGSYEDEYECEYEGPFGVPLESGNYGSILDEGYDSY